MPPKKKQNAEADLCVEASSGPVSTVAETGVAKRRGRPPASAQLPASKRQKAGEAPVIDECGESVDDRNASTMVEAGAPAGLEAWEIRLWGEGFELVAGTDEAGRGPLAGPVVSGAFVVLRAGRSNEEVLKLLEEVNDSKKLTEAQRESLYERLTNPSLRGLVAWAVAEAPPSEIDSTNILRASLASMSRAVGSLEPRPDCVLVDGCNRPPELLKPGEQWSRGSKAAEMAKADVKQQRLGSFFKSAPQTSKPAASSSAEVPWRPRQVESVIEGDGRVPCISAASILAKVHRDRLMQKIHGEYPQYGFAEHKGYGTASHIEAISTHGVCPVHRKSFAPVREALSSSPGDETSTLGGSTLFKSMKVVTSEAESPTRPSDNIRCSAATTPPVETPQRRGKTSGASVETLDRSGPAAIVTPVVKKPRSQGAKTAKAGKVGS